MSSYIVLDARAVFPNAGVRVQDLHYGPILALVFLSNSWAVILVGFFKFSDFPGFRVDFGLMSS